MDKCSLVAQVQMLGRVVERQTAERAAIDARVRKAVATRVQLRVDTGRILAVMEEGRGYSYSGLRAASHLGEQRFAAALGALVKKGKVDKTHDRHTPFYSLP